MFELKINKQITNEEMAVCWIKESVNFASNDKNKIERCGLGAIWNDKLELWLLFCSDGRVVTWTHMTQELFNSAYKTINNQEIKPVVPYGVLTMEDSMRFYWHNLERKKHFGRGGGKLLTESFCCLDIYIIFDDCYSNEKENMPYLDIDHIIKARNFVNIVEGGRTQMFNLPTLWINDKRIAVFTRECYDIGIMPLKTGRIQMFLG